MKITKVTRNKVYKNNDFFYEYKYRYLPHTSSDSIVWDLVNGVRNKCNIK